MAKKKTATSAAKVKEILVNVVLDRSGSMGPLRKSTIDGYNEYLNGLRADGDSTYSITLIQFDTGGPGSEGMLTVSYVDKPLAEVPALSAETYDPRGGTPLYDAIGECVRRVEPKGRGIFTVIITDGEENSSHEFTKDAIKTLITAKEAEGWKFVFLGANIDAMAVGGSLGVAAATCATYAASPLGVTNAFATMSASNVRYSSGTRAYGVGSPQAKAAAGFLKAERSAMMGGRPAVPPTFPTQGPAKPKPVPAASRKAAKRDWKVNEPVPSA